MLINANTNALQMRRNEQRISIIFLSFLLFLSTAETHRRNSTGTRIARGPRNLDDGVQGEKDRTTREEQREAPPVGSVRIARASRTLGTREKISFRTSVYCDGVHVVDD